MARNIGGLWKIIQPTVEVVVFVTQVPQPEGAFTIEGLQVGPNVRGSGGGNVAGNTVSFVLNWQNDTAGSYHGAFDGQGRIFGATFDLKNPGSTAEWHSDRTF
jgi:hypothetical protein